MLDTTDTRMISLDEPVSEGVAKILKERTRWDADLEQETTDFGYLEEAEDSAPVRPVYLHHEPPKFYDWLAIAAAKLSRSVVTGFAAVQIDIARLSSDPLATVAFDPSPILDVCLRERPAVVSVSPGLVMPRSEVSVSSLLSPSGGYLSWMEMLQEGHDGEDQ